MRWQGTSFLDTALPFGLRSAPKVFNAIADAVQWVAQRRGVSHLFHYLDDYITLGPPGSGEWGVNQSILLEACNALGVPVAEHKCEGPSKCLEFLGIIVDSEMMELRLSEQKITELKVELETWVSRSACKKRKLQSLIGVLNHACWVIKPARSFLRRLIDVSCVHKRLNPPERTGTLGH